MRPIVFGPRLPFLPRPPRQLYRRLVFVRGGLFVIHHREGQSYCRPFTGLRPTRYLGLLPSTHDLRGERRFSSEVMWKVIAITEPGVAPYVRISQVQVRPRLRGLGLATDMMRAIQATTALPLAGSTMNVASLAVHERLHATFGTDFLQPSEYERDSAARYDNVKRPVKRPLFQRVSLRAALMLGMVSSWSHAEADAELDELWARARQARST